MTSRRSATGPRSWARRVASIAADPDERASRPRSGADPGAEPPDVVAAITLGVARALVDGGRPADPLLDPLAAAAPLLDRLVAEGPPPPGGWADPWLPGLVHEQAVTAERRAARGAWYTPEPVVRGLVALALDTVAAASAASATAPDGDPAHATPDGHPVLDVGDSVLDDGESAPEFAVDPFCGGGAFLLAVLDRWRAAGATPTEALARVAGTDIDPGAVRVTRWSLGLWAAANGLAPDPDGRGVDVEVADALDGPPERWPDRRLVVGNPPFASPLRAGAVPDRAEAHRLRHRDLLGPYTDLAAVHLLAAASGAGPGSVIALVQPQSILAGRDSGPLRAELDRIAPLHGLWATRRAVFDAGVRACAVVLHRGAAPPERVALAAGIDVGPPGRGPATRASPGPGRWADLAAEALGAPSLPDRLDGPDAARLGSLAGATAGFRDEYYGLVAASREWEGTPGAEPNRLVTVGAVDPLGSRWGRGPCRFGGRAWERPVVEVEALPPKVRTWVERLLRPKVVLATQSRLLEPLVDRDGTLVPATPLIAVTAAPEHLDHVAAVLLAPPVVAWAWRRWFGSALAVDALKLAARQVVELPLPGDRGAWDEAAAVVATGDGLDPGAGLIRAVEAARIMNRAYGADDEVLDWWLARTGAPAAGKGHVHAHGHELDDEARAAQR